MASHYWRSLQQARLSRRQVLAAAGAGAAAAGVLAATRGGSLLRAPTATAASEKGYGGRFQVSLPFQIDTLDPHTSVALGSTYVPRIYNTLVAQSQVDPDTIFFDLAQTMERPDENTWVFGIRPGVKIAPNNMDVPQRNMDAHDAYESFERVRTLDFATGAAFARDWIESHEASADGRTYTIRTPQPYAWFLQRLGSPFTTIPPRELLRGDTNRMRTAAVGGGPFAGSYLNGHLSLNRNQNYYRTDPNNSDAQLPYLDGMDGIPIFDRNSRRNAFLLQQIYQYTARDSVEADQLLNQANVYQGAVEPVFTFISVTMNVKRPPFDDPRIRKAMMHAINRQQYIDLIYAGDARANGLVHWPTGAYALPDEELEELQAFNPELSRTLIQEAGFEPPLEINVMFPANSTIEEHSSHLPIFLQQMEDAGFEVRQDPMDFITWLVNYTNTDYDCSLALNQIYETPETPLDFQHSNGPAGDGLFSHGLQDEAIDAAIDAAKAVTDPQALVDAIHQLQRDIYEAGPTFLPIVSPFSRTLYWNFVKNIPQGLGSAGLFQSDWWLGPEVRGPSGDANCDDDIDAIDASLVLQQSAGLLPALACPTNADVNHDGQVDARDAALILQHNAGLLPELPS